MGEPNSSIIELCEELLARARSGATEAIAVAEMREGEQFNAEFRNMDADEAMRASAFIAFLAVKHFAKVD